MSSKWLEWSQQLQAIAQNGFAYCQNPYDLERYEQVRQLAAEIMAAHTGVEPSFVYSLFEQEEGYATPKVDVRGAVFREDKILLVKEREDGRWTLPGGWVDVGESPSQAVEREVYEESGYQTKATKLLALFDRNHARHGHPPFHHHVYKLFFHCEILDSAPQESHKSENHETEAVAFFAEHQIPELSLTRVMPTQIARLFEHLRHPDWATDFD
ncbi:NUDIX hydrolase [Leptolyngbya sp. FACHB-541]|uniref:NUDIX hydrolase n=1 Tax=Leptolyngbya sp. FACHB-541 TaxID=2692810 RepID=UPI001689BACB|nr:NUDIX hydrolase [Leptolyngbya sp. FACHB-541]MBD1995595.1 NUDIX hydrolase [Leptolyngbya sp. FACHB-541]